jgi:hypothetical protein
MKRVVLEFSVRSKDARTLDEMADLVGAALGCNFADGEFRAVPARVATVLGMHVGLYRWRGQNDESIIRLHTDIVDGRFFESPDGESLRLAGFDISEAIVDLLEVHGAGTWYVPSAADVAAEVEYSFELDRQFQISDEQIREWEAGG